MKAGDVKLGKIFANDHQNVIPLFQRPYVWGLDDNWQPLWADVREAAEEVEEEANVAGSEEREPRTYFLGAIVLQQRWRPPRRLNSSHIVDGQQRLTTLQVLIAAGRAVAEGLGAGGVAGRFKSLVENRDETIDDDFPDDRFKVWPLPQDRDAYLWAVRPPGDSSPPPTTDHRLVIARTWFEQEITEWAKAAPDPATRLDYLYETLNERMQLVQINLEQRDDPQVIFEALNHRGVRLAAADLVKNLLFQRVEAQGDRNLAEDLLTKWWLPLDAVPWRNKVTTGRIERVLVDLLLAYWLTITTRREVLVEHLFVDFKHWLQEEGARAADVIKDLRRYADTYQGMLHLDEHDVTAQLLDRMGSATSTPWPVLLFLHSNPAVPQRERDLAAGAIDSFLMRRSICGMTTKDYNRLFLQVTVAAQAAPAEAAGQAVVDTLASQTADSRVWPTDTEFLDAMIKPDVYTRVYRARLKAFLVGVENHMRTGKTEPQPLLKCSDTRLTIEHLLPQKWEHHWPLPTDDEKDHIRRLESVHQLGNLTLVTSKLNPAMSNKPWDEKRDALKSHSLLRLTTATVWTVPGNLKRWDTARWCATWDEERIEIRSVVIAREALRAWPRPPEPASDAPE